MSRAASALRPGLRWSCGVVAGLVLVLQGAPYGAEPGSEPRALWQRALAAQRFKDFQGDATLTTTFRSGDQVTLRLRVLALLQPDGVNRAALSRVTAGGLFNRTEFLSIEHSKAADDLWIYLPELRSPRRLVSSNLGDSYLGSEFRYGDLVQAEPDEHTVTLRGEESVEGTPCWVIEAMPRDAKLLRDGGLSRQVLWLRQHDLVERKIEQYDRRGDLLKIIDVLRIFTDPASGKLFALERHVRNVRSGTESRAVFENIVVNAGIAADAFSPTRLGDGSW